MVNAFALNFRTDRAVEFYDEVSKLADYAFHDFAAFQVQANSIILALEWTLLDEACGNVGPRF